MSDGILMTFSGAGGATIADMFSRCSDPREPLDDLGAHKTREIVASMAPGGILQAAPAGAPPYKHSSSLAQSMTHNVEGSHLEVGTNDVRGALLHYGGTVVAKDHLLTIPMSKESYGKRASDFPDAVLTFRKTSQGLLGFLIREREVRTTIEDKRGREKIYGLGKVKYVKNTQEGATFLFVLKKSVTLQPHPYLVWTLDDERYLLVALGNWFARN